MEAQQERLAAQQAEAQLHAINAMLAKVQAGTQNPKACAVDEPEPKKQQTAHASLPDLPVVAAPKKRKKKSGVLYFADLNTVEQAFHEWPSIETQIKAQGGWSQLSDGSRGNYNKRRHLVQRIRLLMDPKSHGLSAEAACRVYQHVKQQGDFSVAELRDLVYPRADSLRSPSFGDAKWDRKYSSCQCLVPVNSTRSLVSLQSHLYKFALHTGLQLPNTDAQQVCPGQEPCFQAHCCSAKRADNSLGSLQ